MGKQNELSNENLTDWEEVKAENKDKESRPWELEDSSDEEVMRAIADSLGLELSDDDHGGRSNSGDSESDDGNGGEDDEKDGENEKQDVEVASSKEQPEQTAVPIGDEKSSDEKHPSGCSMVVG